MSLVGFCGLCCDLMERPVVQMESNRKSAPLPSFSKKKDVFQGFEYIPSEFNLVDVLRAEVCMVLS